MDTGFFKERKTALTSVLSRFDESEVTHILNYGRPGSPMPAWGLPGGGPMTEQQIHQLVVYLRSIQLDPEETKKQVESGIRAGARQIIVDSNPNLLETDLTSNTLFISSFPFEFIF